MEPSERDQPLTQALRGAVFPLSGDQLVWLARENEASASVLTLLSHLPRVSFASLGAVQQGVEDLGARVGEAPVAASSSR